MNAKMCFSAINFGNKQLAYITLILFTIMAALRPDLFFANKSPHPEQFFSHPSPVEDYHNGSYSDLTYRIRGSDLSFIMYYAPWNVDCQRFRSEFEVITNHHHNQIFFAAINCWWPSGECRKRYNFKKYPQLIAFVQNVGEVIYTGPLVASYIIPFLDNLVNPVTPLMEESQLLNIISRADGVAVGYFDFNESPQPIGYDIYLKAAVQSLYNDPWRKVKFTAITSRKTANKLGIYEQSSITIYSWSLNSSVRKDFTNSDAIVKWIYKTLFNDQRGLVEWLTPTGSKSGTNITELNMNDTFILLTPRSLILGSSPYYDILREVAMDYYNCDNSPIIKSLIMRSILSRRAIEETLVEMEEKCHEMENPMIDKSGSQLSSDYSQNSCCHSQIIKWHLSGNSIHKKCYCTACVHVDVSKCPANCKKFNCFATAGRYLNSFEPLKINKTASYCNEVSTIYQSKYTPYYKIKVTCSGNLPTFDVQSQLSSSSSLYANTNSDDDNFYLTNHNNIYHSEIDNLFHDERIYHMIKGFDDKFCSRLALGLKYSDFTFPDSGEGSPNIFTKNWREGFTGLACKTNRKVKFVAIDSILYSNFAESLGLQILNETHATIALIIESNHKTFYLLDHHASSVCCNSLTINKAAIYEVLKNYAHNQLLPYQASSNGETISSSQECLKQQQTSKDKVICVPEISSFNFQQIIFSPGKDVILFYYTPWCNYCSSIGHIYLIVAKFFHSTNQVIFTRINADANELPFEYTVDRFPSILIFPSIRKYEPSVFSPSKAITQTTLMNFIFKNAQISVQFKILFSICDRKCLLNEWFKHCKKSNQLFGAYKNRIIELNSLRYYLMKKKRFRGDMEKEKLRKMLQKINKLCRFTRIPLIIRAVIEEGLAGNQISFSDLNETTKNWIQDAVKSLQAVKAKKKNKKAKKSGKKLRQVDEL